MRQQEGMPAAIPGLNALARRGRLPVSYTEAEAAVKELAAALLSQFDLAELRRFRYVAIPRGGLLVLGMLAYVLGLDRRRLLAPPDDGPVVVVDDCSYSGSRFATVVDSLGLRSGPVVFAHLYSHPELRRAILQAEPSVRACISARDLVDPSDGLHGGGQPEARRDVERPYRAYWVGATQLVFFPWSEPDLPVFDPTSGGVDLDWHLAPPDRCLENWAALGLAPLRHPPSAALRMRDDIAYHLSDEEVFLLDLRTEQCYGLTGVAADMWRALVAYGDLRAARETLYGLYDVAEEALAADLSAFADSLVNKGILVSTQSGI